MSDLRAMLLVASGVVLHFFVSLALVLDLVSAAYAFSQTAGAQIGSYDELYRLGPAPQACVAGLALCGLLDFVISLVLVAVPRTRKGAWIVPVAAITLSVAILVVAVNSFQPAVPYVGG